MTQENNVQKKSNPRIVVIALAVICVILAASLVGVIALYQPSASSSQLAEKDSLISSLNEQIATLRNQSSSSGDVSTYVAQIAYLNQQVQALNDQLNTTTTILNLQDSQVLYDDTFTQDANSTTTVFNDQIYYAGYIAVQATATADTTFAEVIYTFGATNFDYNQTIGTSGAAIFPVLPGTVMVRIGNINQTSTNSVTATVTNVD